MNRNECKLEEIKQNLIIAYQKMPDQFALAEIKYNLKKTIESIDKVEIKRRRRKLTQESNVVSDKIGFLSLEDAQKALAILTQMGKEQENIIDNSKSKPENVNKSEFLLG